MDSLVFGILVSIQKIFVRSESQCPDFRAFKIAYVQTIVRSKLQKSRLSCVQNCICSDYRAFVFFSRPCNFERTTPPCAFISVWTYRLSVWDLNLGIWHWISYGQVTIKECYNWGCTQWFSRSLDLFLINS